MITWQVKSSLIACESIIRSALVRQDKTKEKTTLEAKKNIIDQAVGI